MRSLSCSNTVSAWSNSPTGTASCALSGRCAGPVPDGIDRVGAAGSAGGSARASGLGVPRAAGPLSIRSSIHSVASAPFWPAAIAARSIERGETPSPPASASGRAPPLPGKAGRAPPPRPASLRDRPGARPPPAGKAGRAPPPRLASLVEYRRGRIAADRARRGVGGQRVAVEADRAAVLRGLVNVGELCASDGIARALAGGGCLAGPRPPARHGWWAGRQRCRGWRRRLARELVLERLALGRPGGRRRHRLGRPPRCVVSNLARGRGFACNLARR